MPRLHADYRILSLIFGSWLGKMLEGKSSDLSVETETLQNDGKEKPTSFGSIIDSYIYILNAQWK